MTWILLAGLAWVLLGFAVAAVLGRAVRLADQEAAPAAWTDEVDRYLEHHARASGV
jgi:hypothetical protein